MPGGSSILATPSQIPPDAKQDLCTGIIPIPSRQREPEAIQPARIDYVARAQWLRAAILGANDGLVSVASLMVGVSAVNEDVKPMLVSGLAGLVAGACSMAIGEFVSVSAQYDAEVAEMKRKVLEGGKEEEVLPNPLKAAAASALAFALGAVLPLLAAGFVRPWSVRVGVVCAASTLGLLGFGVAGAVLGGANAPKSGLRVLAGGWLALLVTFGFLKLFGFVFSISPA